MFTYRELLAEGFEPLIVKLALAALDELPCACVMRALLNSEVYVADGNTVFDLIVEDRLEGGYDLCW